MLVESPAQPAQPAHEVHLPSLRSVLRHALPNLVEATLVPTALLYAGLALHSLDLGLIAALAWALGMLGWRLRTGRRVGGLLVLAAFGLTLRTAIAMATGSIFWYFLQPVVVTLAVGTAFLLSAFTRRPLVSRLVLDLCPLRSEIAERHRVRRLFRRMTVMWGGVNVLNGLVTLWLLLTLSTGPFLAVKSLTALVITWAAIAITVGWGLLVGRAEGLRRAPRAPRTA